MLLCAVAEKGCQITLSKHGPFTAFVPLLRAAPTVRANSLPELCYDYTKLSLCERTGDYRTVVIVFLIGSLRDFLLQTPPHPRAASP